MYVQGYPDPGRREVVSTSGGTEPVWSRDGRELFFRPLDGDGLMVVEVNSGPSLSASRPVKLFSGMFLLDVADIGIANYDVSPDGERFVMVAPSSLGAALPPTISIVLHWFEELQRLVPTP